MTLWAIIPVKSLHTSKSRLAGVLSAEKRAELIRTILQRTLMVLRQVAPIQQVLVISSDPAVLKMAQEHGAMPFAEQKPRGLNTAVSLAVHHAIQQGATRSLILPADLPLIQTEDVWQMIKVPEGATSGFITICTDLKNDGTNALLLAPPHGFTFHYGPGSFSQHLHEANRLGLSSYIVRSARLQFDLDTAEDWQAYQAYTHRANAFPLRI